MSQSVLYVLNQKSTHWLKSFQNCWGTAPVLWDYLAVKYLGWDSWGGGNIQKLWDLAGSSRLTSEEKICHMMTFDRAYVPVDRLEEAGDACLTVYSEMPVEYRGSRTNHWQNLGQTLSCLPLSHKFHRLSRGVCLAPTTVSDCWSEPTKEWLEEAWPIFEEIEQ